MIRGNFRQSALTFDTTAIQFKYDLKEIKNREIVLDFSSVSFINPFGMLFLKVLFSTLSVRNQVKAIFKSTDVVNYLVRMSFHNHFTLNENVTFIPSLDDISLRRNELSDRLIELTDYSVNNDDDVDRITEKITEIVAPKIEFYEDISDIFQTAISETLSNVEVHSGLKTATVCLQTYGNSIIIAIGDEGIGIKSGLKDLSKGLTDEEAIEKALEPLISSRSGRGGMGLTELSDKIKGRNDCMGIRSKGGYILIENGILRKGKCAELPGAQIMIKLNKS